MTTRGRTPGQPALLRVLNDRAALGLLLDDGPMTRNEIAQRTGLSKPTAAEIIRRLEAAGLLRDAGTDTQAGRRGPSALVYEAITDRDLAVAVDVQLVDVRSTVVDATGRSYPVAEHRMDEDEMRAAGEDIVAAAVSRAAAAAGVDPDLVTAVAVGVQASVDHATDTLIFTDGLPGWPREQVAATLSKCPRRAGRRRERRQPRRDRRARDGRRPRTELVRGAVDGGGPRHGTRPRRPPARRRLGRRG